MEKRKNKILRNNKGFTLVELIIVIAILAVLAGIAAPNLINNINNARKKTDVTNATQIANSIIRVIAEDATFAGGSISTAEKFEAGNGVINTVSLFTKAIDKLQTTPMPKYESSKKFFVALSATGEVTVTIRKDDGSEPKQVYPVPESPYK